MKKTYIIEGYWRKNLGDDLLLYTLSRLMPQCSLIVVAQKRFSSDFQNLKNISVFNEGIINRLFNRLSYSLGKEMPFTTTSKISSMSKHADGVIELGGSIFILNSKNHFRESINRRKKISESAASYYILDANFGPYLSENYVSEYSRFFSSIDSIFFRDTYSQKLFPRIDNVQSIPDLVLCLPEYNSESVGSTSTPYDLYSVINPQSKAKLSQEKYIALLLEHIRSSIGAGKRCVLMSFCEIEGDMEFINNVLLPVIPEELRKSVFTYTYNNIEDALDLFKGAKRVFASRFHAMILGWRYSKPTFVYSYSAKTTNVISDLFPQQTYFDGENERLNIVGQLYTTLPRNKLKIYQRKILQVSSFLDSKA
ncbi:polysaccharide pyruvyl transferase family protein [Levilactobacillus brevis]|uniref:polysaccharide pyruvyl transferase family protein n=1 Tax=Levilactobacillus brevis TaxID=1580 RepID=UPI000B3E81AB|nr:polysaccharide pyruvyl transferase family protein [Levilactobacillus brevis]ARW22628.1 hypothetical protein S101174_01811 [Levilactobacillus brevis]